MTDTSIKAAGIDVAKHKLDIASSVGRKPLQVGNDAEGYDELTRWLRRRRIERVGLEASGGYERGVAAHLRKAGFTVVVFQPIEVRAYATYSRQRAKNDRIDAALIATCTAAKESLRPPPDPRFEQLAEHLTFIEQIEEDLARCKNRLEGFRDPRHRQAVREEMKRLGARRRSEQKELLREVRKHEDLARRLVLIKSVCGLGERTALKLLVRMPELGSLSREEVAALAGLAPYDNDSGKHAGERKISGGRKRLRKALYAAAQAAAFFWNPALKALYARLRAKGKKHKVALVACARKLLIYANTVVERGTPWQKQVDTAAAA